MTIDSRLREPETIMMTKRSYRYFEQQAKQAGTTALVYLRHEFHVSSLRPLKVVAFDSVRDFPITLGKEVTSP